MMFALAAAVVFWIVLAVLTGSEIIYGVAFLAVCVFVFVAVFTRPDDE